MSPVGDDADAGAAVVHVGDERPLAGGRAEVLGRVEALLAVEAAAYEHLSWSERHSYPPPVVDNMN